MSNGTLLKPTGFSKLIITCPNCGYEGKPARITRGSLAVEILLWLFFLIPGFIYSAWRLGTRYTGCPRCNYEYVYKSQPQVKEPTPPQ